MSVHTNLEAASRRQRQNLRRRARRHLLQVFVGIVLVVAVTAPPLAVAAVAMAQVRALQSQVDRLTAEVADLQGVVGYVVARDLPFSRPASGRPDHLADEAVDAR